MRFFSACLLSLALIACDGASDPDDAGPLDAASPDAGPADSGLADAGPPPLPDVCEELGLAKRPFDPSGDGTTWEGVAGDFTVQTLDGPWTLSEEWSGCDSYVFINYASNDYGNGLWASAPDELFALGPRNVHYFFASYDPEADRARARVIEMRDSIELGFDLAELDEEERRFWRSRFHYVTESVQSTPGSVGALVSASPVILFSFAITRQQRFDPVGLLSQIGRGGFSPAVRMARFVSPFYDYLHDLDARLEADTDVTVVPVLDEADVTDRILDRPISLPDAATMAGFDELAIDLEVICRHASLGDCSEWDRIGNIYLCEDAECATRHEIARWITPYWRNGRRRWVMDATPFLGLMRDGGERTLRVQMGPPWERATARDVRVSLRLATRGATDAAILVQPAFQGGAWNDTYNTREPVTFTPPPGTTRVEVVTIISGHGQGGGTNCAEWCNHEHAFAANGAAPHTVSFPGEAGRTDGCAERTGEGVPPGQGGNWAPLRAGWCPGLPVPTRRFDITADVDLSAENTLTYESSFMGGAPPGGDGVTIAMSSYLVFYQ